MCVRKTKDIAEKLCGRDRRELTTPARMCVWMTKDIAEKLCGTLFYVQIKTLRRRNPTNNCVELLRYWT